MCVSSDLHARNSTDLRIGRLCRHVNTLSPGAGHCMPITVKLVCFIGLLLYSHAAVTFVGMLLHTEKSAQNIRCPLVGGPLVGGSDQCWGK